MQKVVLFFSTRTLKQNYFARSVSKNNYAQTEMQIQLLN